MPSGHTIPSPEFMLIGTPSPDGDGVLVWVMTDPVSLTLEPEYSRKWSPSSIDRLERVQLTAELGRGSDGTVYSYVKGSTYAHGIRQAAMYAPSAALLADEATFIKIANVVADELEVDADDEVVQRIAAAVMEAGFV